MATAEILFDTTSLSADEEDTVITKKTKKQMLKEVLFDDLEGESCSSPNLEKTNNGVKKSKATVSENLF